jgi:glycine cleavage system H lipoate-binding protein
MIAVYAVLAITVLVLIDWSLQLIQAWRVKRLALRRTAQAATLHAQDPFHPPPGLFYHRSHTWVFLEPNGSVRIGLDGLAAFLVGRFDRIELPQPGRHVSEGEALVHITKGTRKLEVTSPVDGTVAEVNHELTPDGLFVSSEPYGAGWICQIIPDSLSRSLGKLAVAERATEWHMVESERATEFFKSKGWGDAGLDSVGPRSSSPAGFLQNTDDQTWRDFQTQFLDVKRSKRTQQ